MTIVQYRVIFLLIQRFCLLFFFFFFVLLESIIRVEPKRRNKINKINKIKKGAYYIPRRENSVSSEIVVSLFFRKQSVTLETELEKPKTNKPFCQQFIYFGQPPNNSSRPNFPMDRVRSAHGTAISTACKNVS